MMVEISIFRCAVFASLLCFIFVSLLVSTISAKALLDPSKLLVATIIDVSNHEIVKDALTLVRSIRLNGGRLNDATVVIVIPVEGNGTTFDGSLLAQFHREGVKLEFAPQSEQGRARTLNKFEAFKVFDPSRFDYFLWLDADIVIFDDPTPHLRLHTYPGEIECVPELYNYMRRYPLIKSSSFVWNPKLAPFRLIGENEIAPHGTCNTGVLYFDALSMHAFLFGLDRAMRNDALMKAYGSDRFIDSLLFIIAVNEGAISVSIFPHEMNYMAFFEVEILSMTDTRAAVFAHFLSDTSFECSMRQEIGEASVQDSGRCICVYKNRFIPKNSILVEMINERFLPSERCKYMALGGAAASSSTASESSRTSTSVDVFGEGSGGSGDTERGRGVYGGERKEEGWDNGRRGERGGCFLEWPPADQQQPLVIRITGGIDNDYDDDYGGGGSEMFRLPVELACWFRSGGADEHTQDFVSDSRGTAWRVFFRVLAEPTATLISSDQSQLLFESSALLVAPIRRCIDKNKQRAGGLCSATRLEAELAVSLPIREVPAFESLYLRLEVDAHRCSQSIPSSAAGDACKEWRIAADANLSSRAVVQVVLDSAMAGDVRAYSSNPLLGALPVSLESQLLLASFLNARAVRAAAVQRPARPMGTGTDTGAGKHSQKSAGLGVVVCCDTHKGVLVARELIRDWDGEFLLIAVASAPPSPLLLGSPHPSAAPSATPGTAQLQQELAALCRSTHSSVGLRGPRCIVALLAEPSHVSDDSDDSDDSDLRDSNEHAQPRTDSDRSLHQDSGMPSQRETTHKADSSVPIIDPIIDRNVQSDSNTTGRASTVGDGRERERQGYENMLQAGTVRALSEMLCEGQASFVYLDVYPGYQEYARSLPVWFATLRLGGVLMGSRYYNDDNNNVFAQGFSSRARATGGAGADKRRRVLDSRSRRMDRWAEVVSEVLDRQQTGGDRVARVPLLHSGEQTHHGDDCANSTLPTTSIPIGRMGKVKVRIKSAVDSFAVRANHAVLVAFDERRTRFCDPRVLCLLACECDSDSEGEGEGEGEADVYHRPSFPSLSSSSSSPSSGSDEAWISEQESEAKRKNERKNERERGRVRESRRICNECERKCYSLAGRQSQDQEINTHRDRSRYNDTLGDHDDSHNQSQESLHECRERGSEEGAGFCSPRHPAEPTAEGGAGNGLLGGVWDSSAGEAGIGIRAEVAHTEGESESESELEDERRCGPAWYFLRLQ